MTTAKELPCIFEGFFAKYSESLVPCKFKENQKWRNASAKAAADWINTFAKYLPELSLLCNSLENYSICEKHYNQIVATDTLLNRFISENNSEENSQRKKLRKIEDREIIL